mmetsp:Transcript_27183/g.64434  ORF Transcript_27183/g.64434 Transcript_27183/m.64434 type:complete len:146 (+) Transcript_27183:660-1097(+)
MSLDAIARLPWAGDQAIDLAPPYFCTEKEHSIELSLLVTQTPTLPSRVAAAMCSPSAENASEIPALPSGSPSRVADSIAGAELVRLYTRIFPSEHPAAISFPEGLQAKLPAEQRFSCSSFGADVSSPEPTAQIRTCPSEPEEVAR